MTQPILRDKSGYYNIDGRKYISVSKVLGEIRKQGLERWRGTVGNVEADKIAGMSANKGTKVHAMVGMHLLDQDVALTDQEDIEVQNAYKSYLKYRDEVKFTNRPVIIDFKTSKQLDKSYKLQLVAYWMALLNGEIVGKVGIGFNSEVTLYHPTELYAGTCDAIYLPRKKYQGMEPEFQIVRLCKDKVDYEIENDINLEKCFEVFLDLKNFVLGYKNI